MNRNDFTGRINPLTSVVGVFGYPVKHSASPAMHNAAFLSAGLNYIYLSFEVKPGDIGQALGALPVLGIKGVNLTIPHKESAMPFMDSISEEAAAVGAVNTVKVDSGGFSGFNTDVEGFLKPLLAEKKWRPDGEKATVLGAGGAARAVVFALLGSGAAEIVLSNRNPERAVRLAEQMGGRFPGRRISEAAPGSKALCEAIKSSSLLVNATPLGMKGEMPIDEAACLHPGLLVYDLIYNPPGTPLLAEASRRGADTLGGMDMLVWQGAASFRIWTSADAPVEAMREACEREISGKARK